MLKSRHAKFLISTLFILERNIESEDEKSMGNMFMVERYVGCVVTMSSFVRINASYHHIEKGFTKLTDPRKERRQLSKLIEKFITCC